MSDLPGSPLRDGIVAANYGKQVDVLTPEGDSVTCELASALGRHPVPGDYVRYRVTADGVYLEELLPRRRVIRRAGRRQGEERILAAHVDSLLVVCAVEPPLKEGLIDRYLVTAGHAGIAPTIVLNKIDIDDGSFQARVIPYRELGYPVFLVSALAGTHVEALAASLAGKTSVLVGKSGAGKSSLLMRLIPGVETSTAGVSAKTGKGMHTTTTARVWSGPNGLRIVDSPGIRAFGLAAIEPTEIRDYFVEFEVPAESCRFRNCMHLQETDCAVRAAVEAGTIREIRYRSYVRMVNSLQ